MAEVSLSPEQGRFQRLKPANAVTIQVEIDGRRCLARVDDTVLTAVLTNAPALRRSEFGDGPRAGMCLMGACQDCWIWSADGKRLRACTTPVSPGMRLYTDADGMGLWP